MRVLSTHCILSHRHNCPLVALTAPSSDITGWRMHVQWSTTTKFIHTLRQRNIQIVERKWLMDSVVSNVCHDCMRTNAEFFVCYKLQGSVTITTESSTHGATALSRTNFSGNVEHETMLSWMFTIACCLVAGLGLGLELVSGWLVVMHTYFYYFPLSLQSRSERNSDHTAIKALVTLFSRWQ